MKALLHGGRAPARGLRMYQAGCVDIITQLLPPTAAPPAAELTWRPGASSPPSPKRPPVPNRDPSSHHRIITLQIRTGHRNEAKGHTMAMNPEAFSVTKVLPACMLRDSACAQGAESTQPSPCIA